MDEKKSIFPVLSMERERIHWEDYLLELTPVEFHKDTKLGKTIYVKREDYFAPLGYSGINGSKLRQAIYLGSQNILDPKIETLVGAMSLHSPQLAFQTAVARHFGKETVTVCPGTKLEKVLEHAMPAMAAWFGSKFWLCTIGYNGVLQKRAQELQEHLGGKDKVYYLEYAITLGLHHSAQEIFDFHSVGAEQVKNIPDDVEDLIMPAGSCNSSSSVFLGLAKYRPKSLKRIHLITTGPSKIDYLTQRLEKMGEVTPFLTRIFKGLPYEDDMFNPLPDEFPYEVIIHDSHGEGFASYTDLMPYNFAGIELHPRYEGKVMSYIEKNCPEILTEKSLFWIVGSEPTRTAMEKVFIGKDPAQAETIEWKRETS